MSKTNDGVFIFREWFTSMKRLTPKDYKSLMNAIGDYQLDGVKPPEFEGKSRFIADIIFPYIDRRLASARGGKRSAEERKKGYGVNPIIDRLLDGEHVDGLD